VVKVVHEQIGITHGVITTIHDITNTQVVVDAPHKDLRRARASSLSLIPTSTGSATAIGLIYPELLGKLTGIAVRVPLLNASLTDCVFEVLRCSFAESHRTTRQAPRSPAASRSSWPALLRSFRWASGSVPHRR
jgi:glyceraldehyde 3-phosphate dehydrogenase